MRKNNKDTTTSIFKRIRCRLKHKPEWKMTGKRLKRIHWGPKLYDHRCSICNIKHTTRKRITPKYPKQLG